MLLNEMVHERHLLPEEFLLLEEKLLQRCEVIHANLKQHTRHELACITPRRMRVIIRRCSGRGC